MGRVDQFAVNVQRSRVSGSAASHPLPDGPMPSSTRRVGRCLVQADAVDAAMPGVAAKSWLGKDSLMLMLSV
jgi:hypothetical protein